MAILAGAVTVNFPGWKSLSQHLDNESYSHGRYISGVCHVAGNDYPPDAEFKCVGENHRHLIEPYPKHLS